MGTELGLLADVESTGGASVYRITERSVRRALDAGPQRHELAAFVARHSRTPVPQALSYLIDDAARRHGVLRAGTASAYLRCDDEALLARVLADRNADALGLRLIAPDRRDRRRAGVPRARRAARGRLRPGGGGPRTVS